MQSPSTKPCKPAYVRGFTLIELLVVLAIGSLLAAVAVPAAHRALAGSSPNRSLRQLQSALAVTRAQALKDATELSVTLETANDAILLHWGEHRRTIRATWIAKTTEPTPPQRVRFSSSGLADIDTLSFTEQNNDSVMIWHIPFDPISGAVGRPKPEENPR